MNDIPVQCTRCRNKHMESERVSKPSNLKVSSRLKVTDLCCPRCGCRSYYDLRPQEAWCWASGLIEVGDKAPVEGAILIATGPKCELQGALDVLARHGQGASAGKLLVPGVPEAEGQQAKGDALAAWLAWCGKRKRRGGVVWSQPCERQEQTA